MLIRTPRGPAGPSLLVALILGVASPAGAQSASSADGAYERGDLAAAIDRAGHALRAEDLSVEEVGHLLEIQALAALALGRDAEVEQALSILAAIAPEHELSEEAPPRLRERLAALRRTVERPSVTSEARETATGVRITARPEVRSRLAPELALRGRVGDGEWRAGQNATLDLPGRAGDLVEWYVTVHGLGGLLLASDGSESEPRSFTVSAGEDGGDDALVIGLGVGAAAVAVGVVITIVAVVVAGQGQGTLIDPITVRTGS